MSYVPPYNPDDPNLSGIPPVNEPIRCACNCITFTVIPRPDDTLEFLCPNCGNVYVAKLESFMAPDATDKELN